MKDINNYINEANFSVAADLQNPKNATFLWITTTDNGFDRNNVFVGKDEIFYGFLSEKDVKNIEEDWSLRKGTVNSLLATKVGTHYVYDNCNVFIRIK
jgi:hypothetical protein